MGWKPGATGLGRSDPAGGRLGDVPVSRSLGGRACGVCPGRACPAGKECRSHCARVDERYIRRHVTHVRPDEVRGTRLTQALTESQ